MSSTPAPAADTTREAEPADRVAAAVRAVPGVVDLHGGVLGEVGTYLPGRRVAGIRLREPGADVHVTLAWGTDVAATTTAIRAAVVAEVGAPVDVTVEDVVRELPAEDA